MKRIFILFFVLCSTGFFGQVEKYYKVKITGDGNLPKTLLQLGITIDHSEVQTGEVITEISESELAVVKQNNLQHTVMISDLARFYEERNKSESLSKSMAAGVCNAQNISKPANFHLGSMGGYFTWNEMKQILDSMALLYPNLITVKQALSPQSIEGRDIFYVKISDNPNADESEPEVLYTALHHAREAASLSQLIFYMWYLLENYSTNPDIQATVNSTEMFFVPCVNPDGYVYNQTTNPNGGGMWRKNRRNNGSNFGVDLNRNYGNHWGYDNIGSSATSSSDTYRGTGPFSEPETQAVRDFCNSRQFVNALNAHTYGNLLIYPWGYIPSSYTPDSATFVNWGVLLTEDSRFLYGTGDQTVNYVTNGDSDDWMYGEQISKPKILSITPEAGSAGDGFWPASNRIIDICKTTFNQNYYLARVAGALAIARDEEDKFISGNGFINFSLQRYGLASPDFTVSVEPVGSAISSTGSSKTFSLAQNQTLNDSISYSLAAGIQPGQLIQYRIGVNNGSFIHYDTVTKVFGTPVVLASNTGTATAPTFTTSGTWSISNTKFVSPPGSITESPAGNYSSNQNKSLSLASNADLTNAIFAHLQYYTRFELEKNYDYARVLYSVNNGVTWSPLCGKYQTSPASSGATNPVYDGLQDGWVKEDIDLNDYLGQNIRIRFTFVSDGFDNKDGFYIDDFLLRKITSPGSSVNETIYFDESVTVGPNPSNGLFTLRNKDNRQIHYTLTNAIGQTIESRVINSNLHLIDLSAQSTGIYFLKMDIDGTEIIKKLVRY